MPPPVVSPPVVSPPPPVDSRRRPSPHVPAHRLTQERPSGPNNKDRAVRPTAPVAEPQDEAGSRPRTIIAVPPLPLAVDPQVLRHYDDATRNRLPAPRQFPRGTRAGRGVGS
jgi:hypothetical protein